MSRDRGVPLLFQNTIPRISPMISSLPYLKNLPVYAHKDAIVKAIVQNQVVIVSGSTGSGKTTQLPFMCLEAGCGNKRRIVVTQPRRIAATSIAERLADLCKVSVGSFVGYKTRFDCRESRDTRICCVTDGILLAEIERDPLLYAYDAIMVDEVHERSLNVDVLIGYLRTIRLKRPDLKIILSSATVDTKLFSSLFDNAPVFEIEGKIFPITLLYLPPENDDDYLDAIDTAVRDMIDIVPQGDILVFLPTERDISAVTRLLIGQPLDNTIVLPLFARLPKQQQQRVFSQSSSRKVILATNVAETSLTIPGIVGVIDSGRARVKHYAPHARITRLPVEFISKASADQRKGRCGRVCEGVCIRLYTEADYTAMENFTLPEILRSNLADVILSMTSLGIGRIDSFPFPQPPQKNALSDGYKQLRELGALTKEYTLTTLGTSMAMFPVDAYISRMIIAAHDLDVTVEVLIITAALSIVDPRQRPLGKEREADSSHKKWIEPESDFLSFLRIWDDFNTYAVAESRAKQKRFCSDNFLSYMRMQEWVDIVDQLMRCANVPNHKFIRKTANTNYASIHKALLCGLVSGIGQKQINGQYRLARGGTMHLFPGSALVRKKPEWIMVSEIVETSNVYGRIGARIDPVWIAEMLSYLCKKHYGEPYYDAVMQSVKALEYVSLYGLPISGGTKIDYGKIDGEKATEIFVTSGIVDEILPATFPFLKNFYETRNSIRNSEAKIRQPDLLVDALVQVSWFTERLKDVSSVSDLKKCIAEKGDDSFLCISRSDLLNKQVPEMVSEFPDVVVLGSISFPVEYSFTPEEDTDGIFIRVPASIIPYIPSYLAQWCIRGIRRSIVIEVLKNLPKEVRKIVAPLEASAEKIVGELFFEHKSIVAVIIEKVSALCSMNLNSYGDCVLPVHLKPRLTSLGFTRSDKDKAFEATSMHILENAYKKVVRTNVTQWDFGTIPKVIELLKDPIGFPLVGFPALTVNGNSIDYRLFIDKKEAECEHEKGVSALLCIHLAAELSWFENELQGTATLKLLCKPQGGFDVLKKNLIAMAHAHAGNVESLRIIDQKMFDSLLAKRRSEISHLCKNASLHAFHILEKIASNKVLIAEKKRTNTSVLCKVIADDLIKTCDWYSAWLLDKQLSFLYFVNMLRYVNSLTIRIQKAFADPLKYQKNSLILGSLFSRAIDFKNRLGVNCHNAEFVNYLVGCEEMVISIFAQQEVKTSFTISEKILAERAQNVEEALLRRYRPLNR